MFKKILLSLLGLLAVFVLVLLIRTLTFTSDQPSYEQVEAIEVPEGAIDRFRQSIKFETVSYNDPTLRDTSQFLGLHRFLSEEFPLVDSLLDKKVFGYSLLYKWQGSDESLPAVVLMGHLDVVPVDTSTLGEWEAPPFDAQIVDGRIIGRGTMDDKNSVLALLESVEMLLAENFKPRRTIYLSFGHDEEIGGSEGAQQIATYLKETGERIAFALDEGGYIIEGFVPGLNTPMAVINTGEKGYVSFKMTIQTDGGHSSQPPSDNTIGSLATAITKLESNQFEYRMIPVMEAMFQKIGPEVGFTQRLVFANSWLFKGILLEAFNAHTTIAPTMISGGVKDNVIPTEASAVINFRIMPGESVEDVRKFIIETADDDRIRLETVSNVNEPSTISSHEGDEYKVIERTILELFPEVFVVPSLLSAGTDSKHFIGVADQVYRFCPIRLNPETAGGIHGNNEYCTVDNYKEFIQFNYQLIKNLNNTE